jgi:hypothetical protein
MEKNQLAVILPSEVSGVVERSQSVVGKIQRAQNLL